MVFPSRNLIYTFADQIVSSSSNFVTGVVVARLSGAEEFGEYALVLTIWLVVIGVHRRIITEPMMVTAGDGDLLPVPIAHGIRAELVFGGVATLLLAGAGATALMSGAHIGVILLANAPWVVPLLVQDYWRAVAFQRQQPALALINDSVFAVVQVTMIACFLLVGWRGAAPAVCALGLGGTAGALLGFHWFPGVGRRGDGIALLRHLWPLGRLFLADFVTAVGSQQAYIIVAAILLSKTEYGGFRAATSLMGPVMVILLAAGNVGLPGASRRVSRGQYPLLRSYARRLTAGTLVCVVAYGVPILSASALILGKLYGPQFRSFAFLAVLAWVQYVIYALAFGAGIALRVTGRIRNLVLARVPVTALSLLSLVMSIRLFGGRGAGWAGVFTAIFEVIAVYLIYGQAIGAWRGASAPAVVPIIEPLLPVIGPKH